MSYAPDTALLATPIGTVRVEGDEERVTRIAILAERLPPHDASAPAVRRAADQLAAFFDGALTSFDVSLQPAGTPRGQALRHGLIAVGYGETLSYGALARKLESSARAIGQLCARNPFPIIVPCHRVLATGALGHYSAGGGIVTKQWLLDHERRHGGSA